MAEKVVAPRALVSFIERKFREATAFIIGRARYSIYTESGVEYEQQVGAAFEDVFTKTFRAGFFKSVGDCLAITIYGQLYVPAGMTGSFQIRLSEDSGIIDPVDYLIRVPLTAGEKTVDFTGMARLVLQAENKIQAHGITLSEDASPTIRSRRLPGPFTYNTDSFSLRGISISDAGVITKIDVVQIEFIPAVIN